MEAPLFGQSQQYLPQALDVVDVCPLDKSKDIKRAKAKAKELDED